MRPAGVSSPSGVTGGVELPRGRQCGRWVELPHGRPRRAPPRLEARPVGRAPPRQAGASSPKARGVAGGSSSPTARGVAALRPAVRLVGSSSRTAGRGELHRGRRRSRWGRAPPRPARVSSSGSAGARPYLRRRRSPVVAIAGGRRRPDVLVPHVRGTRGVIPWAAWSFHVLFTRWRANVARHISKNGKCVAKSSLRWQFCNLNCKSGKRRCGSSNDGK
jgi:hypothetical protein